MPVSPEFDLLTVGAGPCAMATAIAAQERGLRAVLVDKGGLCHNVHRWPAGMVLFSTAELISIGEIPFASTSHHPTREECLAYYRAVAEAKRLDIRTYERVEAVDRADDGFAVRTSPRAGGSRTYGARAVVAATGVYDTPRRLGVAGEDLPHVSHYFADAHPYWRKHVVVVGGKNSAIESALRLRRAGARVTLVHRRAELDPDRVKYWILPDILNRIKEGAVAARFETRVTRIDPDAVTLSGPDGREERLPADFVFVLTGYRPDRSFLESIGIRFDERTGGPVHDPETFETNVKGLYVAGTVVPGEDNNKVFIENGRFHGAKIVSHCLAGRG